MGLGLAICRSLVEANEGRIWLVRSDSGGTCIAFTIPLATQEAGRIGDCAVRAVMEQLRPGMKEKDLFAII